ncbi:hypothetical protein LOD99_1929 [Oopsacas minuta]|uniref:EGF-like domain-containing protein n=1 Tax=Oopsacas minuta TaxID=111878 RepID=A0AAV7K3G3_9METZ|nr:hypothetical protein LOD99_1929 [Oopsacas minuta]
MDYLSKQPECTLECEVDMWLVRGIERFGDHRAQSPSPPIPYYTVPEKNYLIQCVLISERVFGPLYYTSCDVKNRLTTHLYSEGFVYYWRCCKLLYQLLQAVVKTNWMPTQASVNEFEVLLHQVDTLLPAFNTDVMTMERFAAYFKCIYTRYNVLLKGIETNMNVSYHKCLKGVLTFLDIWLEKFPSFTTFESVVYRNPVMLEALQLLFHPLTRDEPIFHSIMKSKYFLKNENVLNTFIAVSTPALRLACLSVRIIVEYQLSAETLPAFFHTFIDFHRTAPSKVDFCLTQNIRLVLKYFLILLLSITCLQASAECDFPDDSMKEGFSIGLVLGGSPTMVDSYHSCSVRDQNDTSKYTYIFLTLVIEDDANYYARLSLICNVGIWIVDNTTGTISVPNNPPVFLNSSYLRVDCYECNLNFSPFSSDMYGCMECHDDCLRAGVNTSLGYCYRQSASECCSYSLDGISGPDCSNCDLIGQNGTTWTDCSACICAVDYLGTVCESQYLPCLGTPCQDGGLCIDGIGDNVYTYDCNNMWEGTDCTTCPIVWNWCGDECDTCGFTSCLNGGSPNSTCDGCNCVERWTGIDCSTCEFSSCLNAGTANSTCHGCTCITSWGGFDCSVCGITCGNEGFHNTICTGCDCVESIGRILVVLPVGWTANIVLVHIQIALGVNVLVH